MHKYEKGILLFELLNDAAIKKKITLKEVCKRAGSMYVRELELGVCGQYTTDEYCKMLKVVGVMTLNKLPEELSILLESLPKNKKLEYILE